jgi:hypothetical protein
MLTKKSSTTTETEIRTLSANEVDDISGGVMEGVCIIRIDLPVEPIPFPSPL